MDKITPAKSALIHRKVDEALSGNSPLGVDHEWIEATTLADRLYALELLRQRTYGEERCRAEITKVIEVVRRPECA